MFREARTHLDLVNVCVIDCDAPWRAWTEQELDAKLRDRNFHLTIVESVGRVVAFMAYELRKDHIEVTKIVVKTRHRGRGYGRIIMQRLLERSAHVRATNTRALRCVVPGNCLEACNFLKKMGFKAIGIRHDERGEDTYTFVHPD